MWDTYLYIALMGVSAYLYTVNYRVLTPPLRIISINITITFALTLYAIYVVAITHEYNIHIFHILIILQYALYGWAFIRETNQVLSKRLIGFSIGLFTSISLTISFTIQPWDQFNSYAGTLFNVLVVLMAGQYLWETFVDTKVVALEREAMFWISTGLLFRSMGNFFVDGLMNYLIEKSESFGLTVYWIHELMEFFLFSAFLLALYVHIRYLPIPRRR